MGNETPSPTLGYMATRSLHAIEELYDKYSHPVGMRALASFLNHPRNNKLALAVQELVTKGAVLETARGVWLPADATTTDREAIHKRLSVRKELMRSQVGLLSHALSTQSPANFKRFAETWCNDMDTHLT